MGTRVQGQFCPIVMAAEILSPRWSIVILSEMMQGSTRFNELRRGIPRLSPALLSKRLKELEDWGILDRRITGSGETPEYFLTEAAEELRPIIDAMANWTHKWIDSRMDPDHLDAQLLMWHVRRNLNPDPAPKRRTVVQFIYPELPQKERNYWMIVEPGRDVDLCSLEPGHNVDLFINADLLSMTRAFMGQSSLEREIDRDRIVLTGDIGTERNFRKWFVQSSFAQKPGA